MQALVGAVTGLATGLATMSKKHAKGQSFDGIQNLDKTSQETNTEAAEFKLIIPQSKTVSVRSGQISTPDEEIGNKACKLRVRNKNKNTNIAEAKEDMVAVYYGIDKNSPEFQKIYKYVMEEIKRILTDNGYLIARVNSIDDINYGAMQGNKIEDNYYYVNGCNKRFFSKEDCLYYFSIIGEVKIKEASMLRYSKPKKVLEVLTKKVNK